MRNPLVIARRGNSVAAPENTLAALREAVALGADCVTVDVRCTLDGVPVLMNDATLARTTGKVQPVSAVSFADLRRLDAGAWKHDRYRGETVPTLDEALTQVNGHTILMADIKVDCIERIEDTVNQFEGAAAVCFVSFRIGMLRKLCKAMPDVHAAWMIKPSEWQGLAASETIRLALKSEVSVLSPPLTELTESSVACAHEVGLPIWTWGCDSPEKMRKALDLNVDGIMTSNPAQLVEMMGRVMSRTLVTS